MSYQSQQLTQQFVRFTRRAAIMDFEVEVAEYHSPFQLNFFSVLIQIKILVIFPISVLPGEVGAGKKCRQDIGMNMLSLKV